ncbi:MAG TPA: hypothetical protein VF017_15705 [Thermoanaerobaculia bacterium]|nr:hypothetical protein [Thermoanaerobaculia bacterium]
MRARHWLMGTILAALTAVQAEAAWCARCGGVRWVCNQDICVPVEDCRVVGAGGAANCYFDQWGYCQESYDRCILVSLDPAEPATPVDRETIHLADLVDRPESAPFCPA